MTLTSPLSKLCDGTLNYALRCFDSAKKTSIFLFRLKNYQISSYSVFSVSCLPRQQHFNIGTSLEKIIICLKMPFLEEGF